VVRDALSGAIARATQLKTHHSTADEPDQRETVKVPVWPLVDVRVTVAVCAPPVL
jgi:hypothetical protein